MGVRRHLTPALIGSLVLLLSSCGGSAPEPTATGTTGPVATPTAPVDTPAPSADPAPSDDPVPSADAENLPWDDSTEGTAVGISDPLTVTDLRVATHEGYDRVVLEFAGAGTPGWLTMRSATAVADPTDRQLDLPGAGYLAVVATGAGHPGQTGAIGLLAGSTVAGGTVVTGAEYTGVFEGDARLWLGLTDPDAPYRVFTLTDPTRLVIDVQRSMA